MRKVPIRWLEDHLQADAQRLSDRFNLPLYSDERDGLLLQLDDQGLSLHSLDEPKTGGVKVDFLSATMRWRQHQGGGLKEAVARAVGVKGNKQPQVFDATAGLGRDSFILASLGCHVTLTERHPVVAALLADGLQRAVQAEGLPWLSERMRFCYQPASQMMAQWQDSAPEVVYLDPMFPHRKKSAAVKKDMRLFQQLIGSDIDADDLLTPARQLARHRVVVKRPANAPWLNACKPDIEQKGKANRFDIYLTFT